MSTQYYDVIVSGAGMVGLALANAAAAINLRVALIEHQTHTADTATYSNRVSAINPASERLLTRLGAWQKIADANRTAYQSMQVWDGMGTGSLNFSAADLPAPHLGHIIENRTINQVLLELIEQNERIELFQPDNITSFSSHSDHVDVELSSGLRLHAKVLIGAEGKFSVVREKLGLPMYQWDYQHTAIVATVQHEQAHQHCARQVFLDTGPLAFLPLTHAEHSQQISSIVWSAKTDTAKQLMALSEPAFCDALSNAFEHKLGPVTLLSQRQSFPLSAQHSQQYFSQRAILLGDAAHTIHPLAGLGVNLGFLDVGALIDEWQRAQTLKLDLSDTSVLRRFQRQRKLHNWAVIALMESLKRGFQQPHPALVIARNFGLTKLNSLPLLKRPLTLAAMGDLATPLPSLCQPIGPSIYV